MGFAEWKDGIPKTKSPFNIIFFIVNIVPWWSGWGTMLSACINEDGFNQCQLIIGIVNWLCLCIPIVNLCAWIFSIYWGFLIFQKGK